MAKMLKKKEKNYHMNNMTDWMNDLNEMPAQSDHQVFNCLQSGMRLNGNPVYEPMDKDFFQTTWKVSL